jgi:pyrroline-5-carboxylate reductase
MKFCLKSSSWRPCFLSEYSARLSPERIAPSSCERCKASSAEARSTDAYALYFAAQALEQTGEHPAQIKDRVSSPGGTTIAGLAVLEQRGVRGAVIDAVVAAAARARELGAG